MKSYSVALAACCTITLPLLLSGCASSAIDQPPVQTLGQTTVCCESFDELEFKILSPKSEATLYLDANDPAFKFETGKSYVEPILLPPDNGITLLQIDSLVSRNNGTSIPTVVFPVVTLLDSQHQAIVTLDKLPFRYLDSLFGWRRIQVVVTIDDQYEDAKYALIHTSTKKMQQSLSTRKPVQIIQESGYDTIFYAQPTKSRNRIRFSESGKLNIIAFPVEQG
jgi:hypothetical protein